MDDDGDERYAVTGDTNVGQPWPIGSSQFGGAVTSQVVIAIGKLRRAAVDVVIDGPVGGVEPELDNGVRVRRVRPASVLDG